MSEAENSMYYKVIKKPIDIATIQRRVTKGVYLNDLENLSEDIRLIFKNCYQYNFDDSPASKQAKRLETYFENELYFELRVNMKARSATPVVDQVMAAPVEIDLSRMNEADKKNCYLLLRRFEKQEGVNWFKLPVFRKCVYFRLILLPKGFQVILGLSNVEWIFQPQRGDWQMIFTKLQLISRTILN